MTVKTISIQPCDSLCRNPLVLHITYVCSALSASLTCISWAGKIRHFWAGVILFGKKSLSSSWAQPLMYLPAASIPIPDSLKTWNNFGVLLFDKNEKIRSVAQATSVQLWCYCFHTLFCSLKMLKFWQICGMLKRKALDISV